MYLVPRHGGAFWLCRHAAPCSTVLTTDNRKIPVEREETDLVRELDFFYTLLKTGSALKTEGLISEGF